MKFGHLPRAFSVAVFVLLDVLPTQATLFPFQARRRSNDGGSNLSRRMVDMNGNAVVTDYGDLQYHTNISLNGASFSALIDTGSSDLWVSGSVPNAKNLSVPAAVHYASGSAMGFVHTAELQFDTFTIPDQAFILVQPSRDNPAGQGLVGLGPNKASNVRNEVGNSGGDAPLDRIFRQNMTTPNFLSIYLDRLVDDHPGEEEIAATGLLTIGEYVPKLENITSMPKLPALDDQFGVQHWQTMMDPNGIIGPDGQRILTQTTIPGQKDTSQLHVVFDTGFSYPQVPKYIADSMYGRIPGARFIAGSDSPGYWSYPCNYEVNISFIFSGVTYPIHPLDLGMPDPSDITRTNCMATFQEIAPAVANHQSFGAFDIILGMAFLRNTYLLIDYGDFVDGSSSKVGNPYIQLLSVTEPFDAHDDFVINRLGGVDTTGSQTPLLPASAINATPGSPIPAVNSARKFFSKTVIIIIAASVGGLILLIVAICLISRCVRNRRRGAYQPLHHPQQSEIWTYPTKAPNPVTQGAGYSEPQYPQYQQQQYQQPQYRR